MLELHNTEVAFLNRSILASGNPMTTGPINTICDLALGSEKHMKRGISLGSTKSGEGHDNYLKGIRVAVDIKYPAYWTPEAQRYHWFDIVSSQSKMHRLAVMLKPGDDCFNKYVDPRIVSIAESYAEIFRNDPTYENRIKLLSNLPHGFEMWETVSTNYQQLKTMYKQRKNHRLQEDWGAFIEWCDNLPMFKELTGL